MKKTSDRKGRRHALLTVEVAAAVVAGSAMGAVSLGVRTGGTTRPAEGPMPDPEEEDS